MQSHEHCWCDLKLGNCPSVLLHPIEYVYINDAREGRGRNKVPQVDNIRKIKIRHILYTDYRGHCYSTQVVKREERNGEFL